MPFDWNMHRDDWTILMDRIEILAGEEDMEGFQDRLSFVEALYDFSTSPEGLAIQGDKLANPVNLIWIYGEACGITANAPLEKQDEIHTLVDELKTKFNGDVKSVYKALYAYEPFVDEYVSRHPHYLTR